MNNVIYIRKITMRMIVYINCVISTSFFEAYLKLKFKNYNPDTYNTKGHCCCQKPNYASLHKFIWFLFATEI